VLPIQGATTGPFVAGIGLGRRQNPPRAESDELLYSVLVASVGLAWACVLHSRVNICIFQDARTFATPCSGAFLSFAGNAMKMLDLFDIEAA
jgi:hypothetical protein